MKLLVFSYHFTVSVLLPTIICFLVFNGALRFVAFGLWTLSWCISYVYMDKIILFFLGGREIIDQDNQELFQQLKSETYKRFEKEPKVYLYTGSSLKCFVLESRKEWSVVLDRRLAERMNSEQVKALVDYLVSYKKANVAWRLTKSYGLASLVIGLNYSFWSKVLFLKPGTTLFKVMTFFTLSLFKPFVDAVLVTGRLKISLQGHESLEPLINFSKEMEPGMEYGQFLLNNLQKSANIRDLLLKWLEGIPVIERAVVKRSF